MTRRKGATESSNMKKGLVFPDAVAFGENPRGVTSVTPNGTVHPDTGMGPQGMGMDSRPYAGGEPTRDSPRWNHWPKPEDEQASVAPAPIAKPRSKRAG